MKKSVYLISLMLGLLGYQAFAQKDFTLLSPDKSVKFILEVADSINYSVAVDNKGVVGKSKISFTTDASRKAGWKVVGTKRTFINELLTPVVRQKSKSIQDRCNQLHLDFSNGLSLECRAYNNGVAWRWI
ncbi:MAG: glycoside hydrolase family 97 N-terminal domain-containing protein, partial [Bacteroidota bacterium]|nr:glycoside hydrolase family 97 N-terminal domain-containing protein [Bacteroidota bacterium]